MENSITLPINKVPTLKNILESNPINNLALFKSKCLFIIETVLLDLQNILKPWLDKNPKKEIPFYHLVTASCWAWRKHFLKLQDIGIEEHLETDVIYQMLKLAKDSVESFKFSIPNLDLAFINALIEVLNDFAYNQYFVLPYSVAFLRPLLQNPGPVAHVLADHEFFHNVLAGELLYDWVDHLMLSWIEEAAESVDEPDFQDPVLCSWLSKGFETLVDLAEEALRSEANRSSQDLMSHIEALHPEELEQQEAKPGKLRTKLTMEQWISLLVGLLRHARASDYVYWIFVVIGQETIIKRFVHLDKFCLKLVSMATENMYEDLDSDDFDDYEIAVSITTFPLEFYLCLKDYQLNGPKSKYPDLTSYSSIWPQKGSPPIFRSVASIIGLTLGLEECVDFFHSPDTSEVVVELLETRTRFECWLNATSHLRLEDAFIRRMMIEFGIPIRFILDVLSLVRVKQANKNLDWRACLNKDETDYMTAELLLRSWSHQMEKVSRPKPLPSILGQARLDHIIARHSHPDDEFPYTETIPDDEKKNILCQVTPLVIVDDCSYCSPEEYQVWIQWLESAVENLEKQNGPRYSNLLQSFYIQSILDRFGWEIRQRHYQHGSFWDGFTTLPTVPGSLEGVKMPHVPPWLKIESMQDIVAIANGGNKKKKKKKGGK